MTRAALSLFALSLLAGCVGMMAPEPEPVCTGYTDPETLAEVTVCSEG